jgi:predicted nucleic-acid-binding Zn-ribbon protein
MAKEPTAIYVKGKQLRCPICDGDRFATHRSVMAGRGLAFFDFEWIGKQALNHVCARCGYVYWFVPVKE